MSRQPPECGPPAGAASALPILTLPSSNSSSNLPTDTTVVTSTLSNTHALSRKTASSVCLSVESCGIVNANTTSLANTKIAGVLSHQRQQQHVPQIHQQQACITASIVSAKALQHHQHPKRPPGRPRKQVAPELILQRKKIGYFPGRPRGSVRIRRSKPASAEEHGDRHLPVSGDGGGVAGSFDGPASDLDDVPVASAPPIPADNVVTGGITASSEAPCVGGIGPCGAGSSDDATGDGLVQGALTTITTAAIMAAGPPDSPVEELLCGLCNLAERNPYLTSPFLSAQLASTKLGLSPGSSPTGDGTINSITIKQSLIKKRRIRDVTCLEDICNVGIIAPGDEPLDFATIADAQGVVRVHSACAAWSAGFDSNRAGAVERLLEEGLRRVCVHCRRFGASVRCAADGCSRTYHLLCAVGAACAIDGRSQRIFCAPEHASRLPISCVVCSRAVQRHANTLRESLWCALCSGYFHIGCTDTPSGTSVVPNLRMGWLCMSCRACPICGCGGLERAVTCESCRKCYHLQCVRPALNHLPKHGYKCVLCRFCGDCGSRTPGSGPSSRWHMNYTVCDSCYQQRNKGMSCPLCGKAYRASSKMLDFTQCLTCKRYIHNECDPSISTVELRDYSCPSCVQQQQQLVPSSVSRGVGPDFDETVTATTTSMIITPQPIDRSIDLGGIMASDAVPCLSPVTSEETVAATGVGNYGAGKPMGVIGAMSPLGIPPITRGGRSSFRGGVRRPRGTGRGHVGRPQSSSGNGSAPNLVKQNQHIQRTGGFGGRWDAAPPAAHSKQVKKEFEIERDSLLNVGGCGGSAAGKLTDEEATQDSKVVLFSANDKFVLLQDMCALCGSFGAGEEGRLIACAQCGQCYHPYCCGAKVTQTTLVKGWRCLDCTVCEGCGQPHDEGRLLLCDDCDTSYHTYCLKPPLETVPTGTWKCQHCVICVLCGSRSASGADGVPGEWQANYTQCAPCASKFQCIVCSTEYQDGDIIIQCERCLRWLHGRCDEVTCDDDAERCCDLGYNCPHCRPKDTLPVHLVHDLLMESPCSSPAPVGPSLKLQPQPLQPEHLPQQQQAALQPQHQQQQPQLQPPPIQISVRTHHLVDGVYLTDIGLNAIKLLTVEPPKRTRAVRSKESFAGRLPGLTINTPGLTAAQPSASCQRRATLDELVDGGDPFEFEADGILEGLEDDVEIKRKKKIQKLGIGGFVANARSRAMSSKDDATFAVEGSSAAPTGMLAFDEDRDSTPSVAMTFRDTGLDSEKTAQRIQQRRRRPKKKRTIEESMPSHIQEAFFGISLLSATSNPNTDVFDEVGSVSDGPSAADEDRSNTSWSSNVKQPLVLPVAVASRRNHSEVTSADLLDSSAAVEKSPHSTSLGDSQPNASVSEPSAVSTSNAAITTVTTSAGAEGEAVPTSLQQQPASTGVATDLGIDDNLVTQIEYDDELRDLLPSDLPQELRDDELIMDMIMQEADATVGPTVDATDALLASPLPHMDGQDVEDVFKGVLSPSGIHGEVATRSASAPDAGRKRSNAPTSETPPSNDVASSCDSKIPATASLPPSTPTPAGAANGAQVVGQATPLHTAAAVGALPATSLGSTDRPGISAPSPAPSWSSQDLDEVASNHSGSSTSKSSMQKWEPDEALAEKATISMVLYANLNHPTLKQDFPLWSERAKQIAKIWRNLPTEKRAPYLQRARENRKARAALDKSAVAAPQPVAAVAGSPVAAGASTLHQQQQQTAWSGQGVERKPSGTWSSGNPGQDAASASAKSQPAPTASQITSASGGPPSASAGDDSLDDDDLLGLGADFNILEYADPENDTLASNNGSNTGDGCGAAAVSSKPESLVDNGSNGSVQQQQKLQSQHSSDPSVTLGEKRASENPVCNELFTKCGPLAATSSTNSMELPGSASTSLTEKASVGSQSSANSESNGETGLLSDMEFERLKAEMFSTAEEVLAVNPVQSTSNQPQQRLSPVASQERMPASTQWATPSLDSPLPGLSQPSTAAFSRTPPMPPLDSPVSSHNIQSQQQSTEALLSPRNSGSVNGALSGSAQSPQLVSVPINVQLRSLDSQQVQPPHSSSQHQVLHQHQMVRSPVRSPSSLSSNSSTGSCIIGRPGSIPLIQNNGQPRPGGQNVAPGSSSGNLVSTQTVPQVVRSPLPALGTIAQQFKLRTLSAPPAPTESGSAASAEVRYNYETWLQKQDDLLSNQKKYLETEMGKLRKIKKALTAKQRQLARAGNGQELNDNDSRQLAYVNREMPGLQKYLEQVRKLHRQHTNLMQEYRVKHQLSQQAVPLSAPGSGQSSVPFEGGYASTADQVVQQAAPSPGGGMLSPQPGSGYYSQPAMRAASPQQLPPGQQQQQPALRVATPGLGLQAPGATSGMLVASTPQRAMRPPPPYPNMAPAPIKPHGHVQQQQAGCSNLGGHASLGPIGSPQPQASPGGLAISSPSVAGSELFRQGTPTPESPSHDSLVATTSTVGPASSQQVQMQSQQQQQPVVSQTSSSQQQFSPRHTGASTPQQCFSPATPQGSGQQVFSPSPAGVVQQVFSPSSHVSSNTTGSTTPDPNGGNGNNTNVPTPGSNSGSNPALLLYLRQSPAPSPAQRTPPHFPGMSPYQVQSPAAPPFSPHHAPSPALPSSPGQSSMQQQQQQPSPAPSPKSSTAMQAGTAGRPPFAVGLTKPSSSSTSGGGTGLKGGTPQYHPTLRDGHHLRAVHQNIMCKFRKVQLSSQLWAVGNDRCVDAQRDLIELLEHIEDSMWEVCRSACDGIGCYRLCRSSEAARGLCAYQLNHRRAVQIDLGKSWTTVDFSGLLSQASVDSRPNAGVFAAGRFPRGINHGLLTLTGDLRLRGGNPDSLPGDGTNGANESVQNVSSTGTTNTGTLGTSSASSGDFGGSSFNVDGDVAEPLDGLGVVDDGSVMDGVHVDVSAAGGVFVVQFDDDNNSPPSGGASLAATVSADDEHDITGEASTAQQEQLQAIQQQQSGGSVIIQHDGAVADSSEGVVIDSGRLEDASGSLCDNLVAIEDGGSIVSISHDSGSDRSVVVSSVLTDTHSPQHQQSQEMSAPLADIQPFANMENIATPTENIVHSSSLNVQQHHTQSRIVEAGSTCDDDCAQSAAPFDVTVDDHNYFNAPPSLSVGGATSTPIHTSGTVAASTAATSSLVVQTQRSELMMIEDDDAEGPGDQALTDRCQTLVSFDSDKAITVSLTGRLSTAQLHDRQQRHQRQSGDLNLSDSTVLSHLASGPPMSKSATGCSILTQKISQSITMPERSHAGTAIRENERNGEGNVNATVRNSGSSTTSSGVSSAGSTSFRASPPSHVTTTTVIATVLTSGTTTTSGTICGSRNNDFASGGGNSVYLLTDQNVRGCVLRAAINNDSVDESTRHRDGNVNSSSSIVTVVHGDQRYRSSQHQLHSSGLLVGSGSCRTDLSARVNRSPPTPASAASLLLSNAIAGRRGITTNPLSAGTSSHHAPSVRSSGSAPVRSAVTSNITVSSPDITSASSLPSSTLVVSNAPAASNNPTLVVVTDARTDVVPSDTSLQIACVSRAEPSSSFGVRDGSKPTDAADVRRVLSRTQPSATFSAPSPSSLNESGKRVSPTTLASMSPTSSTSASSISAADISSAASSATSITLADNTVSAAATVTAPASGTDTLTCHVSSSGALLRKAAANIGVSNNVSNSGIVSIVSSPSRLCSSPSQPPSTASTASATHDIAEATAGNDVATAVKSSALPSLTSRQKFSPVSDVAAGARELHVSKGCAAALAIDPSQPSDQGSLHRADDQQQTRPILAVGRDTLTASPINSAAGVTTYSYQTRAAPQQATAIATITRQRLSSPLLLTTAQQRPFSLPQLPPQQQPVLSPMLHHPPSSTTGSPQLSEIHLHHHLQKQQQQQPHQQKQQHVQASNKTLAAVSATGCDSGLLPAGKVVTLTSVVPTSLSAAETLNISRNRQTDSVTASSSVASPVGAAGAAVAAQSSTARSSASSVILPPKQNVLLKQLLQNCPSAETGIVNATVTAANTAVATAGPGIVSQASGTSTVLVVKGQPTLITSQLVNNNHLTAANKNSTPVSRAIIGTAANPGVYVTTTQSQASTLSSGVCQQGASSLGTLGLSRMSTGAAVISSQQSNQLGTCNTGSSCSSNNPAVSIQSGRPPSGASPGTSAQVVQQQQALQGMLVAPVTSACKPSVAVRASGLPLTGGSLLQNTLQQHQSPQATIGTTSSTQVLSSQASAVTTVAKVVSGPWQNDTITNNAAINISTDQKILQQSQHSGQPNASTSTIVVTAPQTPASVSPRTSSPHSTTSAATVSDQNSSQSFQLSQSQQRVSPSNGVMAGSVSSGSTSHSTTLANISSDEPSSPALHSASAALGAHTSVSAAVVSSSSSSAGSAQSQKHQQYIKAQCSGSPDQVASAVSQLSSSSSHFVPPGINMGPPVANFVGQQQHQQATASPGVGQHVRLQLASPPVASGAGPTSARLVQSSSFGLPSSSSSQQLLLPLCKSASVLTSASPVSSGQQDAPPSQNSSLGQSASSSSRKRTHKQQHAQQTLGSPASSSVGIGAAGGAVTGSPSKKRAKKATAPGSSVMASACAAGGRFGDECATVGGGATGGTHATSAAANTSMVEPSNGSGTTVLLSGVSAPTAAAASGVAGNSSIVASVGTSEVGSGVPMVSSSSGGTSALGSANMSCASGVGKVRSLPAVRIVEPSIHVNYSACPIFGRDRSTPIQPQLTGSFGRGELKKASKYGGDFYKYLGTRHERSRNRNRFALTTRGFYNQEFSDLITDLVPEKGTSPETVCYCSSPEIDVRERLVEMRGLRLISRENDVSSAACVDLKGTADCNSNVLDGLSHRVNSRNDATDNTEVSKDCADEIVGRRAYSPILPLYTPIPVRPIAHLVTHKHGPLNQNPQRNSENGLLLVTLTLSSGRDVKSVLNSLSQLLELQPTFPFADANGDLLYEVVEPRVAIPASTAGHKQDKKNFVENTSPIFSVPNSIVESSTKSTTMPRSDHTNLSNTKSQRFCRTCGCLVKAEEGLTKRLVTDPSRHHQNAISGCVERSAKHLPVIKSEPCASDAHDPAYIKKHSHQQAVKHHGYELQDRDVKHPTVLTDELVFFCGEPCYRQAALTCTLIDASFDDSANEINSAITIAVEEIVLEMIMRICEQTQVKVAETLPKARHSFLAQTPINGKNRKSARGIKWMVWQQSTNLRSKLTTSKQVGSDVEEAQAQLDASPIGIRLAGVPDTRSCVLCLAVGDGASEGPGRLLNLDTDQWVHLNCALWSSEVYETVNGSLINVADACRRAHSVHCALCDLPGASVRCFRMRCTQTFHFGCARKASCLFFKDKTMLCPAHQPKLPQPDLLVPSVAVLRRVYISRDEVKQVAASVHRGENYYIRIGSLVFQALGQLLPQQLQAFHTANAIYPCGFRVLRFYWHMQRLGQRQLYECVIGERDGRPRFTITPMGKSDQKPIEGDSPKECWMKVLEPIERMRLEDRAIKVFSKYITGYDLFGLTEPLLLRLIESIPGVDTLLDYTFRYGPSIDLPLAVNPTGCARTEPKLRTHFKRSHALLHSSNAVGASGSATGCGTGSAVGAVSGNATSATSYLGPTASSSLAMHNSLLLCSDLTLTSALSSSDTGSSLYSKQFVYSKASQYRRMKTEWRTNVYLARSKIQGLGLYAARDIEKHTMVIEYIGQVIRNEVANMREKLYEAQNRGIYMFRLDENRVIDATLTGGLARYVNHSCNPNCVTEVVDVEKDQKILIIAKRRIARGEELSYDYKFDFEDDQHKIPCLCGAPNCKKWMN